MERNLHGKNYTNGLNIKVCLVVDSFSRNLKKPISNNQNRYE
jgi:hypothetical protein